ncbi:amidase signature domain-containing protein [Dipodascopsis tothii]|uniref:amidase signature domain-containing protein n=1 Tax=Dipodascopsis tothii TaxID=44089 RepID=UPI0034CE58A0
MSDLKPYQIISQKKIAERDSKIPAEWKITFDANEPCLLSLPETCGLLTERELEITGKYDGTGLLAEIAKGTYTALEVTTAFCKRTAIAQQAVNCCTEIFFDKALERAKELDTIFATTGKTVGPLHGLPISLKDTVNVAGVDSVIGVAAYAFKPEPKNSVVVDVLEDLGAIMYCKTNVPQSMMVPDTDNNVFGKTRNPLRKELSASGSSGGLAALVAMRGSLIGIGTDLGGSIRVPAYTHGLYAIKPSSGRIPYHNMKGFWSPGQDATGILCVNAPMAVSLRDIELVTREISLAEPWLRDPSCQYLPWIEPEPVQRPLAIGVISYDKEVRSLPPIARILEETVAKLKAAGHEIVEMELYKAEEISVNAVNNFQIDGAAYLQAACAETEEPLTEANLNGGLYPCDQGTLFDLLAYTHTRANLQEDWLHYWASSKKLTSTGKPVDALLLPVLSFPPRPDGVLIRSHFTRTFNNLDYPSIVLQAGKIDMTKDDVELPEPENALEKRVHETYAPGVRQRLDGFPIGLQLIGQRQMEPKLFQTANIVSKVL